MKIIRKGLVCLAVLTAGAVGLAPAASAANIDVNACAGVSYRAAVGDVVTFYFDTANGCAYGSARELISGTTGSWSNVSVGPVVGWQSAFTGPQGWMLGYSPNASCTPVVLGADVPVDDPVLLTWLATDGGLAACTFGANGPDAPQMLVYQAVAKSGECDAAHGWAASWQDWAREGKGGAVCQRTLLYSDAGGAWVVGDWSETANKFVPSTTATI
jgi:hypothetical protein